MRRNDNPGLALILTVCAFVSIAMFSVYINSVPTYTVECLSCSECLSKEEVCCQATEDINLYGMFYKMDWMNIFGYALLFVLSLYAFAIIFERGLKYSAASRESHKFKAAIAEALSDNRYEEAIRAATLYPESPVAAVLSASLQNEQGAFDRIKPSMHARQRAIVLRTEELQRGLWQLGALGWTVPLVGFFLFITSVINTFHGIYSSGGSSLSAVAIYLVEALWATVFSILVAIAVIWAHKFFTSKVESFTLEMDKLSLAIIGQIADHRQHFFQPETDNRNITRDLDARPTCRASGPAAALNRA